MLERAIFAALMHHHGQRDKSGEPIILHPLTVMANVEGHVRKAIAVLHDVVEDTDLTLAQLREMEFPVEVVEGVDRLTRRPGESYHAALQRAKEHEDSKAVKIADVRHNLSRGSQLPQKEQESLQRRYQQALVFLEGEE
jgi:(p)ppGpp synthase/HD superfamily hydrolase